jgi:hypothetical protein
MTAKPMTKADDERVARVIRLAGRLAPPLAEVGDREAGGAVLDREAQRLDRRTGLPGAPDAEGEEGQQPEELHARTDLPADRLRQHGPEEAGKERGRRQDADGAEEGDQPRVDQRGEPEAGKEAQHDGRQRGHDLHDRLDHLTVFRAQELGDVDGRGERDRQGEE